MPLTLRILSWNIHKCVGGVDRRYDPQRVLAVLAAAQPDIVLLQEVAQNGRWYAHDRQVDLLGDALGFAHRCYFVNVRFGPRRGEYGNAVLSRFPIVDSENIDLTVPGKKARSVLHAQLRLPTAEGHSRILHTFNLHLGLGERERREQLRRLLAAPRFTTIHAHTPVVVAGDFNDVWGSLGRHLLVPAGMRGPTRPLRTFPAWAPVRALDSMFVRGDAQLLTIDRAISKQSRRASDHLPLLAVVDVSPVGGS